MRWLRNLLWANFHSNIFLPQVIGAIYVTLSLLAILVRNCDISMSGNPLTYMMFLLYFRGECWTLRLSLCLLTYLTNISVSECKGVMDWNNLEAPNPDVTARFPDESEAVHRTFIFALVYLGLYSALIIFALLSLFSVNNSCLGRKSFFISFAPWILVCCAILVMDVLATVYYISDTVSTTVRTIFNEHIADHSCLNVNQRINESTNHGFQF